MKKKTRYAAITILCLLLLNISWSQIPDVSFNTDGQAGPLTNGFHSNKMAIQSNGKIILAGYYSDEDGFLSMAAMRLNADGTTDNTFGVLGLKVISFETGSDIYEIAVQPDDKIILGGVRWIPDPREHDPSHTNEYIEVIRLNADGSKDLSFGTDGTSTFHFGNSFNDENGLSSMSLQSNGKIVIGGFGGAFTEFSTSAALLMRLNANGALDNSFNGNGRVFLSNLLQDRVLSNVVQSDGKIVALAGLNAIASNSRVMRFNSDGSIDPSFGTNGTKTFDILEYNRGNALALQPDGKILIAGNTYVLGNPGIGFWIVTRLNADGSFDNSFGSSGQKSVSFSSYFDETNARGMPENLEPSSLVVLSSDKILVNGTSYDNDLKKSDVALVRLTSAGSLDSNFGDNGKFFLGSIANNAESFFGSLIIQPDGKAVVQTERYITINSTSTYVNRLLLVHPPVITCPANISIDHDATQCGATVSLTRDNAARATGDPTPTLTYKIGENIITSPYNFPVGITTVNVTATNGLSPDAACSFTVTVRDVDPPSITNESASVSILSPANHTMRDVTISYNVIDNCPLTATLTVSSNEPVNGTGDGDTDPDWIVTDNHHVQLRAERSANGDGRIYTITITATDGSGNTAVKTVEVRVPHDIKNPHSGQAFKLGSTVAFEGGFWDVPGNIHTAKWLIDDNATAKAVVTEPSGNKNGKITGSYKFTTAGIYKLQMNITDQKGVTTYTNTSGDLEAIVVIYDPNGGNTYGGGYYNSPAGALKSKPLATGKASYGFAMDYFKNSTNPKGETQFEFKVGDFEFNALNFEYLVISNSMAQFKGTGKIIGGQSGIGFTMTVVDGQLDGSGIDKIRMKIYNKNTGAVIYDNQPGASDTALPTQAVGPNSVIVVQSNNGNALSTTTSRQIAEESKSIDDLEVRVNPNPASTYFNVTIKSNNTKEKIALQVFDQYGRSIEVRSHIPNGATIRVGNLYRPGAYYIRVLQGMQHKEIKLIKVSD
jgi:uncharacterized delta-60 repeat protein